MESHSATITVIPHGIVFASETDFPQLKGLVLKFSSNGKEYTIEGNSTKEGYSWEPSQFKMEVINAISVSLHIPADPERIATCKIRWDEILSNKENVFVNSLEDDEKPIANMITILLNEEDDRDDDLVKALPSQSKDKENKDSEVIEFFKKTEEEPQGSIKIKTSQDEDEEAGSLTQTQIFQDKGNFIFVSSIILLRRGKIRTLFKIRK